MRLGVRGYGVRPLCGREVMGRRDPKLRSAYLGFSGVLPLRGFVAAVGDIPMPSTVTQRSGVNRKVDKISGGVSKGIVLRDQRLYGT